MHSKVVAMLLALTSSACAVQTPAPQMLTHIRFSPDGKWLVAAGGRIDTLKGDGIVKVWATKNWQHHATWTDGFSSHVENIFFAPPDTLFALSAKINRSSKGDPTDGVLLRSWHLAGKNEAEPLHLKHATWGFSVAFHDEGKLLAYCDANSRNCSVFVHPSMEEKRKLINCPSSVLRFSPDAKRVAAARASAQSVELAIHDTSDGQQLAKTTLAASKDDLRPTSIRSLEFSPNSKSLVLSTFDPSRVYVYSSGLRETLLTLDVTRAPDCVKFTPDGLGIAVLADDNSVELFSIDTKKSTKRFAGNPDGANAFCFSADAAWIAIAGGGHRRGSGFSPCRVRVFQVSTGKLVAELD